MNSQHTRNLEREELPDDLKLALGTASEAQKFFDGLTVFDQNTYIECIVSAKKPETRRERVGKTVDLLKSGDSKNIVLTKLVYRASSPQ